MQQSTYEYPRSHPSSFSIHTEGVLQLVLRHSLSTVFECHGRVGHLDETVGGSTPDGENRQVSFFEVDGAPLGYGSGRLLRFFLHSQREGVGCQPSGRVQLAESKTL